MQREHEKVFKVEKKACDPTLAITLTKYLKRWITPHQRERRPQINEVAFKSERTHECLEEGQGRH